MQPKSYGAWVKGGNTWGVTRAYDKKNAAQILGVQESDLSISKQSIGIPCCDRIEYSHSEQTGNKQTEYYKIVNQ